MGSAALTIVPDPDVAGCASVLVDATVGGRTELFRLDTGSPTTQVLLDDRTARWPVVGRTTSSGLIGSVELDLVRAPRLSVADVHVDDLIVHRVAPESSSGRPLVGLDVLGRAAWSIDLAGGALHTLTTAADAAHPLDRAPRGHLLVPIVWGEITATALIDFGADVTLVDTRFASAHPQLLTHVGRSTGFDVTGAPFEVATAYLAPYTIGGVRFEEHIAVVADLSATGEGIDVGLGFPSLVQARWILDLPNDRYSAVR